MYKYLYSKSKDMLLLFYYFVSLCLIQPSLVERLVVVDISPSLTSVHTSFHAYIQAMKEMKIASNIPRSTARRLAEDQLRKLVKVTILTRTVWTFIS